VPEYVGEHKQLTSDTCTYITLHLQSVQQPTFVSVTCPDVSMQGNAGSTADQQQPQQAAPAAPPPSQQPPAAAAAGSPFSFSEPQLRGLWDSVTRSLLKLGRSGLSDSHANSLKELLTAHKLVKVQVNGATDEEVAAAAAGFEARTQGAAVVLQVGVWDQSKVSAQHRELGGCVEDRIKTMEATGHHRGPWCVLLPWLLCMRGRVYVGRRQVLTGQPQAEGRQKHCKQEDTQQAWLWAQHLSCCSSAGGWLLLCVCSGLQCCSLQAACKLLVPSVLSADLAFQTASTPGETALPATTVVAA
jgi:RNA-binding protein YhbY